MANEILKITTGITLSWNPAPSANLYQLQVSVGTIDFSGILEQDDATLVSPTKTFTDAGTNNIKRYWRWRYSTDGGTTWAEWSDVNSYWLNTSASADASVPINKWKLISLDGLDIYQMATFPGHTIVDAFFDRAKFRNRKKELISEFITSKAIIKLNFEDFKIIQQEQMRAFKRFDLEHKVFFLASNIDNGDDGVHHIWKVQFDDDLKFEQSVPNINNLFESETTLVEV